MPADFRSKQNSPKVCWHQLKKTPNWPEVLLLNSILGFIMTRPDLEENKEQKTTTNSNGNSSTFFTKPPHQSVGKRKKNISLSFFMGFMVVIAMAIFHLYPTIKEKIQTPNTSSLTSSNLMISSENLNWELTNSVRKELSFGRTPDFLKQASPEIIAKIKSEQMSFYKLKIVDTIAQDGDIVKIYIDNLPYAIITLSHIGAEISIPLQKGIINSLQVHAIFDGGGGVTFGAYSNSGEVFSKVMQIGEVETWHIGGI